MEKKKLFSLGVVVLLVLTFSVGYYYIVKTDKKNSSNISKNQYEGLAVDTNGKEIYDKEALKKQVNKDDEILFEISCNKDGKFIVERSKTAEEEGLVGKKGADLEEKYKKYGYKLKKISNGKVELIRESIKYKPNRYVLLSENNEIVIAKSDNNGSIFDENGNIINKEGTGTKIYSLREQDISNIINGDTSIQFDSIEKLNDGIKDFDIRYEMPE
ncbi:hypothetical protein [Clostridium sp.]|jgi:hypothetical protein|uniref:hypothetical protein n=1 Tax=Clostridium sp. TaxID=1506 RepID=UPI0039F55FFC